MISILILIALCVCVLAYIEYKMYKTEKEVAKYCDNIILRCDEIISICKELIK